MESATVAANGFRYRIPNATLLCVSDKPLHGPPKLAGGRGRSTRRRSAAHVEVAVEAVDQVRRSTRTACRAPTSAPPTSRCSGARPTSERIEPPGAARRTITSDTMGKEVVT